LLFRSNVSGSRNQTKAASRKQGAPIAIVSGSPKPADKAAVSGGAAKLTILP
jgi:hypothetical protein